MGNELDLTSLTEDGDTLTLSDGRILRLHIEADDDIDPFAEYDCYGTVATLDSTRLNAYGERPRPPGFDGNAERLTAGADTYWWQPPADSPKRGTPEFESQRKHVRDLLEYGLCGFILEVLDGPDVYGRPISTATASLWGIEPLPTDEYRLTIITDLAAELGLA